MAALARQFLPSAVVLPLAALLIGSGATLSASVLSAATAHAAGLAPHRAWYAISLLSAKGDSDIATVTGDMAVQWDGDCGGWTMTNRSIFDIGFAGGKAMRMSMEASSWENVPPTRYTFAVRTLINGEETERFEGTARKGPRGGEATFSLPEPAVHQLAAGTMFPLEHTVRVLEASARAESVVSATVFDGFTDGGAALVNAVIGRSRAAPPKKGMFPALEARPSWSISLAFFPADTAEAEPQSEIGMRIFDNGIADRFTMDFGEFKVFAELRRLEASAPPKCRRP